MRLRTPSSGGGLAGRGAATTARDLRAGGAFRRSQRGTSLVEVLVVMVVLLVGIFTIVRMFPIGFTNLRRTENATMAYNLARGQVEWWKNNQEKLPDGVASLDPTVVPLGTQLNPAVIPDDLGPLQLPGNVALPPELQRPELWSDVNKTRRVLGEVTRIPAPTQTEQGLASLYFVSLPPLEWPQEAFSNPDKYVLIYGSDLIRVDVTGLSDLEKQGIVTNLKAREYAVDYQQGALIFNGTGFPRQFRVSYSYPTPQGLRTATGEIIDVPRRPRGFAIEVPLKFAVRNPGPNQNAVEPLSERVARKFRNVGRAPFTADEYEYRTLVPSGGPYSAAVQQVTGGLVFNPAGHRAYERSAQGVQPLLARIDYTVADWHVLHEDKVVPDNAPYSVKLALPFIKQAGVTTEYNGNVYRGLLEGFATGQASRDTRQAIGPSVVAVNLATGGIVADGGTAFPTAQNNLGVDFRLGIVHFGREQGNAQAVFVSPITLSPMRNSDVKGTGVRIFYRADGDWAVALQKANEEYHLLQGLPNGLLPYGRFWVGRVVEDPGTRMGSVFVSFPITDAGKSVVLNYTYTDKDGVRRTVYGVQGQIVDRSSPWENGHPYLLLRLPPDASLRSAAVVLHEVRGTSLRCLTVWREGSRWRRQEVSTYLTRSEI